MFHENQPIRTRAPEKAPCLIVVIDTEEEFDWGAPFDRNSRSVTCIRHQHKAQDIFHRYGIVPTYVVDYAVAEDETAVGILREWAEAGTCLIGAHLHPWVNPPYEEEVNRHNSYPGNLPYGLEKAKLERLTDLITTRFGQRPVIYKAGRYGAGKNTARILAELGYEIDASVVADTDFSHDQGPDFRGLPTQPYFFQAAGKTLLELPNARGYDGLLAGWGSVLYPRLAGQSGVRSLMAGVLSKLRLLERIPLTPEGISAADQIRMVRRMARLGHFAFHYAYHSSSLMVGGSPYVCTERELQDFLNNMEEFFDFFLNDLGGEAFTPLQMRDRLALPSQP
tara:strand:- start:9057 stop:10067 length:1011 start_codon:yes stop_codon:yes gene_type:complete